MEHIDTNPVKAVVSDAGPALAGRRRHWTAAKKLALVEESFSASRTIVATARLYGLSDKILRRWRKAYSEGHLAGKSVSGFVPFVVSEAPGVAPCAAASGVSGRIEIVSSNGRRVVAAMSSLGHRNSL